jgi:hypothetical protein
MARYRRRETRWVHGACVAGAYLVVVAGLYTMQVGAGLNVPVSVAVSAPPLVYAALAIVLLREAPFVRRLSWVGSACVAHVLLGCLAAAELTWASGLALPVALAQVFVLFPPAPVLTLVATPLTLAAFGLTSSKPVRRGEPAPRPAMAPRTKPLSSPVRAAKRLPEAAAPPAVAHPTPSVVAPAAAPPAAAPPPPVATWPPKPPRRGDDGMVRVSFARIAAQLPAEAFVLPFERLSESLREPHLVLVPRRVVLSQMRDGAVAITWAHIASQFPDLALGMSDDEFRNQYPDLKLWLPMEELVSQLPAGVVPAAPVVEGVRVEAAPAPVLPTANGVVTSVVVDPAVVKSIAACFSGVGTFETATEQVADTTVVAVVQPGLRRAAVSACAAPLVRALARASADVITLRTEHAAIVLAVARTPVVVAARLPGAPVALLAQRATRAAAAVGRDAPSVPAPARRALEPVSVDGPVAQAAQTVRSLGVVDPTVFADGPARVYVVSASGGDDKAVAALALDLCDALGASDDLGRPRAVVLQRGASHTLVRPLARGGVLAVTGTATRPGRLLREAERAASLLEAM